jgi:hypothetical protein
MLFSLLLEIWDLHFCYKSVILSRRASLPVQYCDQKYIM